MASLSDKAMMRVLHQYRGKGELYSYHKRVLTRTYPEGSKILSGNFNPLPHWRAGVQMAALNLQTTGLYSRINKAMFSPHGNSGYILKKVKRHRQAQESHKFTKLAKQEEEKTSVLNS